MIPILKSKLIPQCIYIQFESESRLNPYSYLESESEVCDTFYFAPLVLNVMFASDGS